MSRAFIREDGAAPERRYVLPDVDDPAYDAAAADALLRGAHEGDTASAEEATGFRWGDPHLVPHVRAILADARRRRLDRVEILAERYLRAAGVEPED